MSAVETLRKLLKGLIGAVSEESSVAIIKSCHIICLVFSTSNCTSAILVLCKIHDVPGIILFPLQYD